MITIEWWEMVKPASVKMPNLTVWWRWFLRSLVAASLGLLATFSSVQATDGPTDATPEAQGPPTFFIQAIGNYENQWFDLRLEPGESTVLTAGIQNTGTAPAEVRPYITNANNSPNGGFLPGAADDELVGASLWFALDSMKLTILPGALAQIQFDVTVPTTTLPGEYVAALSVETINSFAIPGSETFRQILRNSISIEITVPGDATSGFSLGDPVSSNAPSIWILDIPITNTGTARIRPQGELTVTTLEGERVSTTQVKMGSVYGGNTTSVRATLPSQLPAGDYIVSLTLTDEATGATASIENAPVTFAEEEPPPVFAVQEASVIPNGDPVRYADIAATIANNGPAIPTANITLNVERNGETVESYPLARNQALPEGGTTISQRYIPMDGWEDGTYTFQLVISAVQSGTETVLATVDIEDEIVIAP